MKALFRFSLLMSLLASVEVFACADKPHDAATPISVTNAYIRALPPGQPNTAAFLTLKNTSDKSYKLGKLHSNAAEKVELHNHTMADGVMQMRPIENFEIAAGEEVVFAPGGKHIMFIGLKKSLKEGDEVLLNLCFTEFCQQIILPAISVLNEPASKGGQAEHHHHH
jgi:copper(I)-binding protein